jgi:hypothetical protein
MDLPRFVLIIILYSASIQSVFRDEMRQEILIFTSKISHERKNQKS